MRRHLALITEHPDDEMVGLIRISESQTPNVYKNEERVVQMLDTDTGERWTFNAVGLGYVDFEDEDDYDERIGEETRRKLTEVDEEHLEKVELTEAVEA